MGKWAIVWKDMSGNEIKREVIDRSDAIGEQKFRKRLWEVTQERAQHPGVLPVDTVEVVPEPGPEPEPEPEPDDMEEWVVVWRNEIGAEMGRWEISGEPDKLQDMVRDALVHGLMGGYGAPWATFGEPGDTITVEREKGE